MTAIKQTAIGTANTQITNVFNRPLDAVDVCSEKIAKILAKIAHLDFLTISDSRLIPPNIAAKNTINCIDDANSIEIEKTYALWDEITNCIGSDATGSTERDYKKASFFLNQLFLAKFKNDFPGFKLHATTIYCENKGADLDEAYVLIHLIHYMYLSCQIGARP